MHEVAGRRAASLYESTCVGAINQPSERGFTHQRLARRHRVSSLGANDWGAVQHSGPDQFAFVTLGSGLGTEHYVRGGRVAKEAPLVAARARSRSTRPCGGVEGHEVHHLPLAVGHGLKRLERRGTSIYVTGATSTSASNNTILAGITDSSGYNGTLSGTAASPIGAPARRSTSTGSWTCSPPVRPTMGNGPRLRPRPASPRWSLESPITIGALLIVGLLAFVVVRRRRAAAPAQPPEVTTTARPPTVIRKARGEHDAQATPSPSWQLPRRWASPLVTLML